MQKLEKSFVIPINKKEDCDRLNATLGTNYKSTDEHIEMFIEEVCNMLANCGNEGGWYVGDCINVKLSMEYECEDK